MFFSSQKPLGDIDVSLIGKWITHLSRTMIFFIGAITAVLGLTQGQAFGQPVPAHRVVIRFQYSSNQGGVFEVLSWNAVTKALPPSDELPTMRDPVSGFYYELQSSDGTVLYRRIIENPIIMVTEEPQKSLKAVAPNQERPSLDRKIVIPQEQVFSLLIPRAGAGDQLVLFSSPFQSYNRTDLMDPESLPDAAKSESTRLSNAAEEIGRISFIPSTQP